MEDLRNERSSKLHILSDLKRLILFILDKKFKTRIVFFWKLWWEVEYGWSGECWRKYVEQKVCAGPIMKSYKIRKLSALGKKRKRKKEVMVSVIVINYLGRTVTEADENMHLN